MHGSMRPTEPCEPPLATIVTVTERNRCRYHVSLHCLTIFILYYKLCRRNLNYECTAISWSAWWPYLWTSFHGPWAMSMHVHKIMQRVIMTLVAVRVPHCSAHYTCSVLLVLMGRQCPIPCDVAYHGLNRCTGSAHITAPVYSWSMHCTVESCDLWPGRVASARNGWVETLNE